MNKRLLLYLFTLLFSCMAMAQQNVSYEDNWPKMDGVSPHAEAIVQDGNTVYLGGSFTELYWRKFYGAAIDKINGYPLNSPQINGVVRVCIPDGSGGWYIGGSFTQVAGQARNGMALINADGSLNSWNPGVGGLSATVYCMCLLNGTLYLGGDFSNVGGQTRNYLAAVDAATGIVSAWNPNPSNTVTAIIQNGAFIYIGGNFTTVVGQTRYRIASFDGAGVLTTWSPNANGGVSALAAHGATIFAAGAFTSIGGQQRNGLAGLDDQSALATTWNPVVSGQYASVNTLATDNNGRLYIGGHFSTVDGQSRNCLASYTVIGTLTNWNPGIALSGNSGTANVATLATGGATVYAGGSFDTAGGVLRHNIAAIDISSGSVLAWNPNANGVVYGIGINNNSLFIGGSFFKLGSVARNRLAALDATTGVPTSWAPEVQGSTFSTVHALLVRNGRVYIGGQFNSVDGQTRHNIAAIDQATGNIVPWNPDANNEVRALTTRDGVIYAGGDFSTIGGSTRSCLAAIDTGTGIATTWNPNVLNGGYSHVYALARSGSNLYAGGIFSTIGGQNRSNLAAIDTGTGIVTAWNPNVTAANFGAGIYSLLLNGNTIYAGGGFNSIGGQARNYAGAVDLATGLPTVWNPNANLSVATLVGAGSVIYAGGSFTAIGGQARNALAALDISTGAATGWDAAIGNNSATISAIEATGNHLYVSGSFTIMGGVNDRLYFMPLTDALNVIPSVVISASDTTLCPSAAVTLTATIGNAGNTPSYQWEKNGTPVPGATAISYTDNTPATGDSYDLILTTGNQTVVSDALMISVDTALYWTGAAGNGLWTDAANWSCAIVPTAADNVVLPASATITISSPSAACDNLIINGGTVINFSAGAALHVSGAFQNNGTINTSGGSLQIDNP